jgi:hypothetical protein
MLPLATFNWSDIVKDVKSNLGFPKRFSVKDDRVKVEYVGLFLAAVYKALEDCENPTISFSEISDVVSGHTKHRCHVAYPERKAQLQEAISAYWASSRLDSRTLSIKLLGGAQALMFADRCGYDVDSQVAIIGGKKFTFFHENSLSIFTENTVRGFKKGDMTLDGSYDFLRSSMNDYLTQKRHLMTDIFKVLPASGLVGLGS